MVILGVDCTASSASAAIVSFDDESAQKKILSFSYTNVGLTHSQTLVPIISGALNNANLSLDDIDIFSINAGPGSFTGVRIGVAALKGLTSMDEANCMSISTLESMAFNLAGIKDCIVCAAMDARCGQVYSALFKVQGEKVERLTEDMAVMIDDLETIILEIMKKDSYDEKNGVIFVGDGAHLCYNILNEKIDGLVLADESIRHQNAVSVAECAYFKIKDGEKPILSEKLLPVYLRAPQAERELKKKAEMKK